MTNGRRPATDGELFSIMMMAATGDSDAKAWLRANGLAPDQLAKVAPRHTPLMDIVPKEEIPWEAGPAVHAHSIEDLSAGRVFPGKDCEECRPLGTVTHTGTVTAVDHEKKTITVDWPP